MDAPWHFIDDGLTLDKIDPEVFFGSAYLLDVGNSDVVTAEDIRRASAPRLLIKSRNSRIDPYEEFRKDFVALNAEAARECVEKGITLIGIDYLSIGPYKAASEVHRILLKARTIVVEGLRLDGLREGIIEFVILPMPLCGADGAPCRAFVKQEE
jgi:arylformamidase